MSPLFIVLYMRRKWWGISATFLGIVASTAAMAVGTYVRGWSALTLDGAWVVKYSQETYTTPYFRVVSYLIGMLFAMMWHEKQVINGTDFVLGVLVYFLVICHIILGTSK